MAYRAKADVEVSAADLAACVERLLDRRGTRDLARIFAGWMGPPRLMTWKCGPSVRVLAPQADFYLDVVRCARTAVVQPTRMTTALELVDEAGRCNFTDMTSAVFNETFGILIRQGLAKYREIAQNDVVARRAHTKATGSNTIYSPNYHPKRKTFSSHCVVTPNLRFLKLC